MYATIGAWQSVLVIPINSRGRSSKRQPGKLLGLPKCQTCGTLLPSRCRNSVHPRVGMLARLR
jgi:hypothetical protein